MKVHEFKHEMTQTSAVFARQSGVQVVFEGDQACTDGKTITLPALPENMDLTDDLVKAMRGYVDHEAGHHRHTDLPLTFKEWDKWKKNGHESLGILHNCVEDIWMEEQAIDDYVGAEKNLKATDELVSKKELEGIKPMVEAGQLFGGKLTVDEAMLAISKIGREHRGSATGKEIIDLIPEKLQAHAREWKKHILAAKNTADCIKISKAIYELIQQDPNLDSEPEDFDPESGADAGETQDDAATPEQKSVSEGKEGPPTKGKGDGEGEGKPIDMASAIDGEIPSSAKGQAEGEHKGDYRILTTRHDKVVDPKEIAQKNGLDKYNKQRDKVSGAVNVMRAKLRRTLLSKQRRDWDGGREVGKLDSKRLVAAYQRVPTVFKQRVDRKDMNTAVQILVDLSGSMYGEKAETAEAVTIALAECFEGTGLSYQITGFDSKYHEGTGSVSKGNFHRTDANVMYNFKPFDTVLRSSRAALGSLAETGHSNNADRDAILWSLNALRDRQEERKILLVLSDGCPYNATRGVGNDELLRHAALAVKYGKEQGIECIGIGIQDSSVKKIYPDAVVIKSVDELSGTVFRKFTDLLMKGQEK